jgi:hypothetical protein
MPLTTRAAIALLIALPLAACDNEVKTVPGLAPDLAPSSLAESICPAAYRCCSAGQLMSNRQAGTDVASCEMNTEAAFKGQVAGIKSSQEKGRVIYDGLKVQACVDFLKSASCTDLQTTGHFTGLPACSSFIQPQVAVGAACGQDFECIDGYCDKTGVAEGQNGDGKCRAFSKQGQACSMDVRCGSNLICDDGTSQCVPLPPVGPAPANACFYSSGCSYAGGDRGASSVLAIGLLLIAVVRRRGARGQRS